MPAPKHLIACMAAAIAAAVLVVYWPALRAGFIWDDDAHVTTAALRSGPGLARIWTDIGVTQQYYPFLHSTFWVEHRLWGDHPAAYHGANIALHGLVAVLFGLLLHRLRVRGALVAALIFAIHPVQAESVAWISEQKNTLSAVFYLGAALAYLRFDDTRRISAYVVASGFFLLALLTKTVTATLPAALLVILWWRRGKLSWRGEVQPLAPWFVAGAAAGLFTAWVERRFIGAEGAVFDLSLVGRALLAGRVVWFYLGKLVWPANLAFVYPRWTIDTASVWQWAPALGVIVLLAILWRGRRWSRGPYAAALLYGIALFPVLGLFNIYPFQYSFVADHFQYLASLPLIACAAALIAPAPTVTAGRSIHPRSAVAGLMVAALALLGRSQTHIYQSNETLFRATVARNPAAWMAWNNLGKELMMSKPRQPEAIQCLERAISLRPDYPEAHNNLGLALTQSGRPLEGIPHLETSLRLKPAAFQTHNNLGIALASSGRAEEALRAFADAAALNPTLPNIHENWAKALRLLGRDGEADTHFTMAARLRRSAAP